MATFVYFKGNNIIHTKDDLNLNVGDIFNYNCSKISEDDLVRAIGIETRGVFDVSEKFQNMQKISITNKFNSLKEQEELFSNKNIKLIVVNKSKSIYQNLVNSLYDSSSRRRDDSIEINTRISVEIYDSSYIRDKKLNKLIDE
jgi:hypothetical protein